jgi:hypothetical protein
MEGITNVQQNHEKGRPKKYNQICLLHSQSLVREKTQDEQASQNIYTRGFTSRA